MNNIQIFTSEEFGQIRTLTINNDPWFVGKDVALALGYVKPRNALAAHVTPDDKKEALIQGTPGGTQNMTVINESGVYSLIFGSKLESAKRFKHWVTAVVLPTIRKHGAYATPQTIETIIKDPDFGIKLLQELKSTQTELAEKSKLIEELQPKASYYDLILQCKGAMSATMIAKDYGMSACKFNSLLHDLGIQFKQSGRWFLYAKYDGNGYSTSKTTSYPTPDGEMHSRTHMYWTQKGRLFLYNFLKDHGYVPTIERDQDGESDA